MRIPLLATAWSCSALFCGTVLSAVPNPRWSPHSESTSLLGHLSSGLGKLFKKTFDRPVLHQVSQEAPFTWKGSPETLAAQYGNDLVLRFALSNDDEAKSLADSARTLLLDTWDFSEMHADVRISRDMLSALLGLLPQSLQASYTVMLPDVPAAIIDTFPKNALDLSALSRSQEENLIFHDYQPLAIIEHWMKLMESFYKSHVSVISVGTSAEGREILAFKLGVGTDRSSSSEPRRKTLLVTGGSHAREWVSTSTVMYGAYAMFTSYGQSAKINKLLEEFDWIFIPTLNPDGYEYTWNTDRLWRKNRQETDLKFCHGLDIDRSFGYAWDGLTASENPCSESFAGSQPWQASEASSVSKWIMQQIRSNETTFVAMLDFHSYSQQVLYPYAFSCEIRPPSLEDLEELALGLAKAIYATNYEHYDVVSACQGSNIAGENPKGFDRDRQLISGGGSFLDWMYHESGMKYAYQIKLRDTGSYGFLLPNKHILPTGREAYNALIHLGEFLLSDKGIEHMNKPLPAQASFFEESGAQRSAQTRSTNEAQKVFASPSDRRALFYRG